MQASNVFIAMPKDNTLEALLSEGFAAMERRFQALDQDKAGLFTFRTLEIQLSSKRLANMDKLQQIYKSVDKDGTGTLDFSEYLALLYLWAAQGESLNAFFSHAQNVAVVSKAFTMMETAWIKYDADMSRRLSMDELTNLLTTELPNLWANSQGQITEHYPESERAEGLRFPKYMHLLYACLNDQTGHNIPGNYTKPVGFASNEGGMDSSAWAVGVSAFKALETDFARFDVTKDGFLDLAELTGAFPIRHGMENLTIHSRLEAYYNQVDHDSTQTLDFFEFMYLSFLMSQDGCYADLVSGAEKPGEVKMLFLRLIDAYHKADSSGNRRLSKDEISGFFMAAYGYVPSGAEGFFDQFAYNLKSASDPDLVLDIVRTLKLVYHCLIPDLQYPADRYAGASKPARNNDQYAINASGGESSHLPRINPVQNSHFSGEKKLGEGGQGAVWLGSYDGVKVAAKVMHGQVTPEILADLRSEVQLLTQIDHPNCHYMLGCKLQPDGEGGPLLLTEVCDEGSIFDLYTKKRYTFKDSTAWRFAMECAAGFEFLHSLGYMHRDIKSLNVFMATGFVCKVADFGMATKEPTASDFAGTAQWMAPEVLMCMQSPRPYDKRCDIYSYAILVWEIYHSQIPYSHVQLDQMGIARAVLAQGIRPMMTGMRPGREPLPPGIAQFIQACWATDPNQRPQTFGQVLQMLAPLKPAE